MEIKSLTGLRGIAAVWVMLFHFLGYYFINFYQVPIIIYGYMGVDLFFILSAFVLALSYSDKFKSISISSWISFMKKRFIRIYPLYFFCIVTYLLWKNDLSLLTPIKLIPNLFLLQNLFSPNHIYSDVTWSLSVEWMAYLIFPFLIFINNKLKSHFFNIILVLMSVVLRFYSDNQESLFIGSFLKVDTVIDLPYNNIYGSNSILRMISAYLLGLVVYNYRDIKINSFPVILLIFILLLANKLLILIPILFSLIILSFLHSNRVTKIINWKPFHFFGLISYSIYLVHYFLLQFIVVDSVPHLILIILLTLVISYGTYELIEKRKIFRRSNYQAK